MAAFTPVFLPNTCSFVFFQQNICQVLPLHPAWAGLWDVDQHTASLQILGGVGDICTCGHASSDRYCGEEALLWSSGWAVR